jgi:hypothetical protein
MKNIFLPQKGHMITWVPKPTLNFLIFEFFPNVFFGGNVLMFARYDKTLQVID